MFSIKLLFCALLLCFTVRANSQTVHRRFEYKYSFKPPYLAQKDGSVPFWEYGGNAIASGESVRLAPSLRSQKGAIWTKQPVNFDWWEVDVMFKVTGRGRIGADGLAFWYTSSRGDYAGEVFGSSDRWTGLAVIFDSFDNDNKHNNPYVMAVLNDGTKLFDHKSDGSQQMLSGCLRDFRNKPFPTRARIEYYQNTLTVHFHNGMTNNEADYELCFRAENVVLPRGGHFGLSAATGGLADDHDVVHLLATSLHATQQAGGQQISNDEQQKLSQEYQEYQRKLEQQKEDYRKEHPDEVQSQEYQEYQRKLEQQKEDYRKEHPDEVQSQEYQEYQRKLEQQKEDYRKEHPDEVQSQEYQEYQRKLEQQKEDYRKEHPDEVQSQEYQEYQRKLEQQKEDYRKEHPDEVQSQEYQEYQRKLEQQKEDYRKEHPDEVQSQEYQEYQRKLEQQKEDYRKEHPDEVQSQEYQEYQRKLEQQKEDYRKEHPDEVQSQEYQEYQRKLEQQKEDYRKEHPDEVQSQEYQEYQRKLEQQKEDYRKEHPDEVQSQEYQEYQRKLEQQKEDYRKEHPDEVQSQEYQEYQRKLEQQKEDYRKEHPDEVRDKDGEFDDWFESDGQRELRQIFQGQGQIHDVLRELNKKVDEVIGKQMNSLSMLSAVYSHAQGQPLAAPPGQAPMAGALPVARHEWEALLANNQLMINTIAELKGFIIEVSRKADGLAAAGGGGAPALNPQFLSEVRDSLQQVQQTVNGVAQRISSPAQAAAQGSCPPPNCVGLTALVMVVASQLGVMLLYNLYKERKEAQAKKFF